MEYTSYVESTIYKMIIQPHYVISDIETFLLSIHHIVNNTKVKTHLDYIVNDKWTYDNILKLINQHQGILTLIQYIVLLLFLNGTVKYINLYHEQIVLKILLYIFFVLVPKNTTIVYTLDERVNILYYCMNIY